MSGNPWPVSETAWLTYAGRCTAFYPLMATDWKAHAEAMYHRRLNESGPPEPEEEPPSAWIDDNPRPGLW